MSGRKRLTQETSLSSFALRSGRSPQQLDGSSQRKGWPIVAQQISRWPSFELARAGLRAQVSKKCISLARLDASELAHTSGVATPASRMIASATMSRSLSMRNSLLDIKLPSSDDHDPPSETARADGGVSYINVSRKGSWYSEA